MKKIIYLLVISLGFFVSHGFIFSSENYSFTGLDIGNVNIPGSVVFTNGEYTVSGSGSDIYNRSDNFYFVYWNLSGNGSIIARVNTITNTNGWAKAGVMIRESLGSGSVEVAAVVSAENGIASQWRSDTAGTTSWMGTSGSTPYWLKLERIDDNFLVSKSTDGVNWFQFQSIMIPMGSDAYIGICVTAHDEDMLNRSTFDNVKFGGNVDNWVDGPGSDPGSSPIAYLHQRYSNRDISGYNGNIDIVDNSGMDDFYIYPEFNRKKITLTYDNDIFMTTPNITISFKVQPEAAGGSNTILSSENLFSIEEEPNGGVTSIFYDNGTTVSTLTNNQSSLKTASGNHVAAILGEDNNKLYFNGEVVEVDVEKIDISGSVATTLTIGPYPGKIWDIRIHNRALTHEEVMEEAKWFTDDVYKPDLTPNSDYPNGLVGIYRTEWWPQEENLEDGEVVIPLDTYRYYLFAQERAVKYYYFQGGMLPDGREDEYMGLEPDSDLILSHGIRNTFVRKFSFSSPQTVNNGNFWLHENFHSFQGPLKGFLGFGGNKWWLEATAEWGPNLVFPGVYDTLLAYYTMAPHMPLWINQSAAVDDLAGHQYKGGHQYGAYVFLWYLTTYITDKNMIGRVFNDPRVSYRPQEALFDFLGDDPVTGEPLMRKAFGDFASRTITWDYELSDLFRKSENGSLLRIMNAAGLSLEEADNRFPAVYDAGGTGNNWVGVPADHCPGSWGYNAYKCESVNSGNYTIEFKADDSNNNSAYYEIRVVVYDPVSEERNYYSVNSVVNGQSVYLNNISCDQGDELYLVVATTPDIFSGDTERFEYEYKIYQY